MRLHNSCKTRKIITFTLAALVLSLTAIMPLKASQQISPEVFEELPKSDRLLLDVRSIKEYSDGHIPTSVNMPLNEIEHNVIRLSNFRDFPIVVYCQSGQLADQAIALLVQNGFTNVKHLEGDMLGWANEKRAINSLN